MTSEHGRVLRAVVYLHVATRFLVVRIVQAIVAVADRELRHVFGAVRPTLHRNARQIAHIAQINDQLLGEIGILGRPRCTSLMCGIRLIYCEMVNDDSQLNCSLVSYLNSTDRVNNIAVTIVVHFASKHRHGPLG